MVKDSLIEDQFTTQRAISIIFDQVQEEIDALQLPASRETVLGVGFAHCCSAGFHTGQQLNNCLKEGIERL